MEQVVFRKGRTIYDHSPFLPAVKTKTKHVKNQRGDMTLIHSESGEIMAPVAGFWEVRDVDGESFVKLFIQGVTALAELSPAGTKAFACLYDEIQKAAGKDLIFLSFGTVNRKNVKIGRATFYRGIGELIDKSFIAPSVEVNWYFVNPAYIWNGDRLAFVQEYRKKKDNLSLDTNENQISLDI